MDSQQILEELLETLLKDECRRHDVSSCALYVLESVYLTNGRNNGFKHHYSGISQVLFTASQQSARKDTYFPEALPYLSSTISDIISTIEDENHAHHNAHLLKMLNKLQDHIELEILRINYSAEMNLSQEDKLGNLSTQITLQHKELENISHASNNLESSITKAHAKLQNAQKDYIAILAIFAAVIIAFSGGFSFIANAFDGLNDIDLNKLLCLASFVGIILIDLVYFLLRFVWGIIRLDRVSEKTTAETTPPKKILATMLSKEIPSTILPLAVINVFLIVVCIHFYSISSSL